MTRKPFAFPASHASLAFLLVLTGYARPRAQTPVAAANARPHRLTLEDLLSIQPIGETALSPDGKTFAMVRAGQIVLMPSAGGWPETLTSTQGGKDGLSWSPDGRMLAYASEGSIWVVPAAGGNPMRLTHAAPGPGDPRSAADRAPEWSPAGRWILFETGRRGRDSLMVVSEDGITSGYLTDSMADEAGASWSPDGKAIAYVERTPAYFSGKLKLLKFNPDSGQAAGTAATLYTAPTDRGGGWEIRKPAWSPDGRELAVVLQDTGWNHIDLIPVAGGTPKRVTEGEYEDTSAVFSPDGKSLAVVSNRKMLEESDIWIVPAAGGTARELAPFATPGDDSSPIWSPDGKRIYFHRTTPFEANDLLAADLAGGPPRRLTHATPRNFDTGLVTPEKVQWRSKDGLNIVGILYKPPEMKHGARYPAVLWIHGGPEGQDTFRLNPWAQYLAQHGYVVLTPNFRGGTGQGEKFRNLNVEDAGGGETGDVAGGAQYLIAQGYANPKRMAIGGGSHGGTMVAYMVTKYPDLFQAAIELYGAVDRATFVERTNRNTAIRWMMKMGGTPEEKPDVYRKADSLADVDKIETPLLIMHGEDDPQVPPYESAQFVKALKAHGKVFYYFTYPNELHGFSQPAHRLDAWRKQLAFLEKYIHPEYGLSTPSIDDLLAPPAPSPRPRQ
ncbi:MAG TPA: S9 family peptidase [Candidatus Acidoferrales bacterium]|nr:S9 family peptidase [Candidatus Acidoferrales bacterium]